VDAQAPAEAEDSGVRLDAVLGNTVEELRPVAATRNVQMQLDCTAIVAARGGGHMRELLFRLLDSVVSLAREASDVQICARRAEGESTLVVRWIAGSPPAYSPFSAPELGLLIVQASWEQAGGNWNHIKEEGMQTITLRLPLAGILEPKHLESTSSQEPVDCSLSGSDLLGDTR
jgi:hypothetical protein